MSIQKKSLISQHSAVTKANLVNSTNSEKPSGSAPISARITPRVKAMIASRVSARISAKVRAQVNSRLRNV